MTERAKQVAVVGLLLAAFVAAALGYADPLGTGQWLVAASGAVSAPLCLITNTGPITVAHISPGPVAAIRAVVLFTLAVAVAAQLFSSSVTVVGIVQAAALCSAAVSLVALSNLLGVRLNGKPHDAQLVAAADPPEAGR